MSHAHTGRTDAEMSLQIRCDEELRGECDFGLYHSTEEQEYLFTDDEAARWDDFYDRHGEEAEADWFDQD